MNKQSVLNKIYVKSPFNKSKTERMFNKAIEEIKNGLIKDKFFDAGDFGVFYVEHREMKNILDAKKSMEILLPPRDKILFTPSEKLIKSINAGK